MKSHAPQLIKIFHMVHYSPITENNVRTDVGFQFCDSAEHSGSQRAVFANLVSNGSVYIYIYIYV